MKDSVYSNFENSLLSARQRLRIVSDSTLIRFLVDFYKPYPRGGFFESQFLNFVSFVSPWKEGSGFRLPGGRSGFLPSWFLGFWG